TAMRCPGGDGRSGRWRRSVLLEGETELLEQCPALFVVRCGRDDRDVHAPGAGDLVDIDLVEHRLLVEAERVVAVAVELLARESPEVTDTRERDGRQAIEELPHAVAAQ